MTLFKKLLPIIILIAVIVGIILSYPLKVLTSESPLAWIHELIVLFSFFTIQTNTLIALSAYALLSNKNTPWQSFWRCMPVLTSVTVYIVFMGLVHHFLLAKSFTYDGPYTYSNLLHHYLTPLLAPVLWMFYRKQGELKLVYVFSCLAFPIGYLVYWFFRGSIIGSYPYFFIDVNAFGYAGVLLNALGFLVLMLFFAFVFFGLDRLMSRWFGVNNLLKEGSARLE